MGFLIDGLTLVLNVARPLMLGLAVVTGAGALASWASRTRRIKPFSTTARLTREHIDPLFVPVERRVVRSGGQPANAPWWALAVVVVGGLLLISGLEFLRGQLVMAAVMSQGGAMGILKLVLTWGFAITKLAIIARVIASWVGGSAYSKWWRWAFVITDPFMIPLRRVLPTFGPIDVTPIVAYFGVVILQSLVLGAL